LGGDIRLNAPIERIVTAEGKVTGIQRESGQREAFEIVVSNADIGHTYNSLLSHDVLGATTRREDSEMSHSMSVVLIYFGTRKKYPNLAQHNVIFGLRYKELLEVFLIEVSGRRFFALPSRALP